MGHAEKTRLAVEVLSIRSGNPSPAVNRIHEGPIKLRKRARFAQNRVRRDGGTTQRTDLSNPEGERTA